MIMRIITTTDRKFVGHIFDSDQNPIILDGIEISVDSQILLSNGTRFVSSNYIIDAEEDK